MLSHFSGPSSHVELRGKGVIQILASLLASLLLSQPMLAYEQEVKRLSAEMAETISKTGKKTVAVVDFTDLQGNVTELGRFLAEEFSVALATAAKNFDVIDRTNLKTLLQEHKLASTGIIDPQTARKLGQITGVQALVSGTITPFGDSVRLSVKILDSATATVIGGFTGDIPRTKAIEELLAKGISDSMPTSRTTPSVPVVTGSGPQPAQVFPQKEDDFSFDLKSCQRSGTAVICKLLITNEGGDRQFSMYARWQYPRGSRIFDQAGNEYGAGGVHVGNRENEGYVETLLVSGIPTSATLVFDKVSADATRLSLLEISCRRRNDRETKDFVVQIRNVPLGR